MKPFDLESAKLGDPYTIRGSNNPHTFLRVMKRGDREKILGVFVARNGEEHTTTRLPEELCMLPKTAKRWIVSWCAYASGKLSCRRIPNRIVRKSRRRRFENAPEHECKDNRSGG